MASASRAASHTQTAGSVSRAVAQYTMDARLHAAFEQSGESGRSFDYTRPVLSRAASHLVPEQEITAYLSKIQRGGHIQPFGCTIAMDDSSFCVIAYSENTIEMLDLMPQSVPVLEKRVEPFALGTDVRTLFTPSSSLLLQRAASVREVREHRAAQGGTEGGHGGDDDVGGNAGALLQRRVGAVGGFIVLAEDIN